MTTKFIRFTQQARELVRERFNSLMGLMCDAEGLRQSFERQAKGKVPGVDGIKKEDYGVALEQRITALSNRLRCLGYRPKPVRRVYIPKGDGRSRSLGIPSFEDRLVRIG
jgi:RNA-directed DNA polymerase